MDFSIIEGLTDEEILELYDDSEQLVYCSCCYGTYGNLSNHINFGSVGWNSWNYPPRANGYCAMQLTTFESCRNICDSLRIPFVSAFDTHCVCSTYGRIVTWSECSR